MRSLAKTSVPPILENNREKWTSEFLADQQNTRLRYRYREKEIKKALLDETSSKCVYCESKVGHNTPGDVEHKTPVRAKPELAFEWDNMTIACTECNRRKSDYYDVSCPFIDPYRDPVESLLVHHGPVVGWVNGDERTEVAVRTLELNSFARHYLIVRKIEKIEELNTLLARRHAESNPLLQGLIEKQINGMKQLDAEYSGMIMTILSNLEA